MRQGGRVNKFLLAVSLGCASAVLFGGALTEKDWSLKKLSIEPKETKTETVGRRSVVWYSHATDPAWGAKRAY